MPDTRELQDQVQVVLGDLTTASTTYLVIPATTSGTYGEPWWTLVQGLTGRRTPKPLALGAIDIQRTDRKPPAPSYLVFAATLRAGEPTSPATIRQVGAQLGQLDPTGSSTSIATPLLGSGVGLLDPDDALRQLVFGFIDVNPQKLTLAIYVRDERQWSQLTKTLALLEPSTPPPSPPQQRTRPAAGKSSATTPAPTTLRPLNPAAAEVLELTARIARLRSRKTAEPADVLLGALYRYQQTHQRRGRSSSSATAALLDTVPDPAMAHLDDALAALGGSPSRLPSLTADSTDDARVAQTHGRANTLAVRLGRTTILPHHLVAAAALNRTLPKAITDAINSSTVDLRRTLRSAIAVHHPNEPASIWDEVLGPLSAPRPPAASKVDPGPDPSANETTRETVPDTDSAVEPALNSFPEPHASGESDPPSPESVDLFGPFRSDYVGPSRRTGQPTRALTDELGVDDYVAMLAALIARRSTAVPVSIGLFGQWGSGKSHFMQLMRDKIDTLRLDGSRPDSPYYSDIIQITFNAWHYADTNLWASLAAKFFEQLAEVDNDQDVSRQDSIAKALNSTNAARIDMQTALDAAITRTESLRVAHSKAVTAVRNKQNVLDKDLLTAVLADGDVHASASQLAAKLDLPVNEILDLAAETRHTKDDIKTTQQLLVRRSLWLPAALLLVTLLTLGLALLIPDDTFKQWTSGTAWVTAVAAVGIIGNALRLTRKAVASLHSIAVKADGVREQTVNSSKAVKKHREQLDQATAQEASLRARLRNTDRLIGDLERELTQLEPGRRLYQFIADRAASADYRSQLGVISLVREDFEHLVTLMHDWRNAQQEESFNAERKANRNNSTDEGPEGGSSDVNDPKVNHNAYDGSSGNANAYAENGDDQDDDDKAYEAAHHKPIDRIVLYIDDLDRCEPDQVVQVLQAVHLLLAMDLFVVVVGVDPRWLLRALRRRYSGILSGDTLSDDELNLGYSETTPQNYLEKIFQIPFALPTMDPAGFNRLLHQLTAPPSPDSLNHGRTAPASPPSASSGNEDAVSDPPPRIRDSTEDLVEAGSEARAVVTLSPDESSPEHPTPRVEAQPLTTAEITLLAQLAPLVVTPRAAIRLINIYGLLRSARDLSDGSPFLGTPSRPGDYQAVIQLLAVLSAEPEFLGPILWGRRHAATSAQGLCAANYSSWSAFINGLYPSPHDSGTDEPPTRWRNHVIDNLNQSEADRWQHLTDHLVKLHSHAPLDDITRFQWWGPQIARFSFLLTPENPHQSSAAD